MLFSRLAQYILKGRWQAIIVALIGHFVLFLTQFSIGLVTLKKGVKEGLLVSLWALLPSVVLALTTQTQILLVYASVANVLLCLLAAYALKVTVSWPKTLVFITFACALSAAILVVLAGDLSAQYNTFLRDLTAKEVESASLAANMFAAWGNVHFAAVFAFFLAVGTVISLLFARWMQAMVSNPGGFKQEFHSLRLPLQSSLLLMLLIVVLQSVGNGFAYWSLLFALPLFMAGLGLIHGFVGARQYGTGALVALYVILVVFYPIALFITLIGLIDSWIDCRKKLNLM